MNLTRAALSLMVLSATLLFSGCEVKIKICGSDCGNGSCSCSTTFRLNEQ